MIKVSPTTLEVPDPLLINKLSHGLLGLLNGLVLDPEVLPNIVNEAPDLRPILEV